jgi:hypothetical protein
MGAIRNTSQADINVSTEAGVFLFPAGKVKGDLAAERIAEIEAAGAVYFTAGELVNEDADEAAAKAAAEAQAKADAEVKAKADEAAAKAAKKK